MRRFWNGALVSIFSIGFIAIVVMQKSDSDVFLKKEFDSQRISTVSQANMAVLLTLTIPGVTYPSLHWIK